MASINFFYRMYAEQFMTLNLDSESLFISIPSESDGLRYRVDMNEETMQATKCGCQGFRYHGHCKHCTIVNGAFAKTSEYLRQASIEAAMDTADAQDEAYELAAIADQLVVAPVIEIVKVRKVATPLVRKRGNKLVLVAAPQTVVKKPARTLAFLPSRKELAPTG